MTKKVKLVGRLKLSENGDNFNSILEAFTDPHSDYFVTVGGDLESVAIILAGGGASGATLVAPFASVFEQYLWTDALSSPDEGHEKLAMNLRKLADRIESAGAQLKQRRAKA